MFVKYISRVAEDIEKVRAEEKDTGCIDFATGNGSRLMTTMGSMLEAGKLSLIGSCVAHGMVFRNGAIGMCPAGDIP